MNEEIKMTDVILESALKEREEFSALPVEEQIRRDAFKWSNFAYKNYIKIGASSKVATTKAHAFFLAYLKYKPCFNELQKMGASYKEANAKAKEMSGIDLL